MSDNRLSYSPSKFVAKMDVVDDLQLSEGSVPGTKKYQDWQWKSTESTQFTTYRKNADDFYEIMKDKKNCPTEIRDEMKVLIREVMDYDHGKLNGHHLFDLIGINGTLKDCESAGVKKGTPLAKAPSQEKEGVIKKIKRPLVSLRDNLIIEHLLSITNTDTPESRALPEGIRCCRVYRFIGTEPPKLFSQYQGIGNVKRGLFLSSFKDLNLDPNAKLFAYYIACYETTKGELLEPSLMLEVEIFIPSVKGN